jgi:hypothetical protein
MPAMHATRRILKRFEELGQVTDAREPNDLDSEIGFKNDILDEEKRVTDGDFTDELTTYVYPIADDIFADEGICDGIDHTIYQWTCDEAIWKHNAEKPLWDGFDSVDRIMTCRNVGWMIRELRSHGLGIVKQPGGKLSMAYYVDGDIHETTRKPLDFGDPIVRFCRGLVFDDKGVVVSTTSMVAEERVDWTQYSAESLAGNEMSENARMNGIFVCPNGVNVRVFRYAGKLVWVTYKLFERAGPRFIIEKELEKKFDLGNKLAYLDELAQSSGVGGHTWLNFILFGNDLMMSYRYSGRNGVLSGIGSSIGGQLIGNDLIGLSIWNSIPHLHVFGHGMEASIVLPGEDPAQAEGWWIDLIRSCLLSLPGVDAFESGDMSVCEFWRWIPANVMLYQNNGSVITIESKLLRMMNSVRGNCFGLDNVTEKLAMVADDIASGKNTSIEAKVWVALTHTTQ